jgi:hypothetical protein
MMRSRMALLGALVSAVVLMGTGPASAASPWHVQASPNVGTDFNQLDGVAAVSATDVWAVGLRRNQQLVYRTLIEHFDGTSWKAVQSPNAGTSDNFLVKVTALSSTDIWAVGRFIQGSFTRPLAEHFDGISWKVVPTPTVPGAHTQFLGVAAIASNDVWAVGLSQVPQVDPLVLTEHWDGRQWSIVPAPTPFDSAMLFGATAVSSNDVWAVGSNQRNHFPMAEHWDGRSWSVVPTPSQPGFPTTVLYSASAIASDDVWAVGIGAGTIAEHWDGQQWSIVSTPNPGLQGPSSLNAVVANGPSDVWAAGYTSVNGVSGVTLTEHFDGSSCSLVSTPNRGHNDPSNRLFDIASAAPSGPLWTVGDFTQSFATTPRTLVLTTAP